jgi:hypothetical protein
MENKAPCKLAIPYLVDSFAQIEYDRDTGLLWATIEPLVFFPGTYSGDGSQKRQTLRLALTPKMSQELLDQLPILQSLLRQASKGPTKPDFLQ